MAARFGGKQKYDLHRGKRFSRLGRKGFDGNRNLMELDEGETEISGVKMREKFPLIAFCGNESGIIGGEISVNRILRK